jgi:glycosyltransferase involved in cell wall biosynthesis
MNGAQVYIMPFRVGSGTRFKLIEAMAAGKAVVSTSMGCEGFSLTDRQDLLIEDEPQAFAQAVIRLLDRPEVRSRLGQAARLRAADYDWRVVIPKFDEVYRELFHPNTLDNQCLIQPNEFNG